MIEFGTSIGIPTLLLAAAPTDNGNDHILATELSEKEGRRGARLPRRSRRSATHPDRRHDGDLADVTGSVELVLLDGWKDLCLPVLQLVEPRLAPVVVVLADDITHATMTEHLDYARNAASGYVTVPFHIEDGLKSVPGLAEPPDSAPKISHKKEHDMATPDRDSLANGLVRIGEQAVAKSNDALLDDYFTVDYRLHSPAGDFNRDQIKAYFAALRESFTNFTISRPQILVDGNFVTARTVMAGRFDNAFAYTPVGTVGPNGQSVRWELINIFRYSDDGRLVDEWVQTDTYDFLRQLVQFQRA